MCLSEGRSENFKFCHLSPHERIPWRMPEVAACRNKILPRSERVPPWEMMCSYENRNLMLRSSVDGAVSIR